VARLIKEQGFGRPRGPLSHVPSGVNLHWIAQAARSAINPSLAFLTLGVASDVPKAALIRKQGLGSPRGPLLQKPLGSVLHWVAQATMTVAEGQYEVVTRRQTSRTSSICVNENSQAYHRWFPKVVIDNNGHYDVQSEEIRNHLAAEISWQNGLITGMTVYVSGFTISAFCQDYVSGYVMISIGAIFMFLETKRYVQCTKDMLKGRFVVNIQYPVCIMIGINILIVCSILVNELGMSPGLVAN